MAPATMELSYFQGPGRADVIRILLHAAKADWKNAHVTYDEFPALKPSLPLGCLPTLSIDGTTFCQSVALQRYVAKQVDGMYPTDNLKALVVDELMDTLNECLEKCPFSGTDEEKKVSRPAFQKDVMVPYFGLVESRIQTFGSGTSVCGVFTVADISLMAIVNFFTSGFMDYLDKDFFTAYPGILEVVKHAKQHTIVKEYEASVTK